MTKSDQNHHQNYHDDDNYNDDGENDDDVDSETGNGDNDDGNDDENYDDDKYVANLEYSNDNDDNSMYALSTNNTLSILFLFLMMIFTMLCWLQLMMILMKNQ